MGEWFEETYKLPLPLGAIAVRRDLPWTLAHELEEAIGASLRYAFDHPKASRNFIKKYAQELADPVIEAHIATFVTRYSLDLGSAGRRAITKLLSSAAEQSGRSLPSSGLFLG